MRSPSLVPVLLRALIFPCLLLVGLNCKSPPDAESESPQPAAPESPQPTAPEEAKPEASSGTEAAPAAPSSAPAEVRPAVSTAALSEAAKLSATTKRTAAGLPEPLPGCVSWLRLKANAVAPVEGSPHHAAKQAYILLPERDRYSVGEKLSPPLKEGTTVALEEKKPEDDFIRRLSVMTREKEGWKFLEYSRNSSQEAFAPAAAAGCSDCHAKATATDSVYSLLTLE